MPSFLWLFLLFGSLDISFSQEETVTVKITQGELKGKVAETFRGLKYYSFQGIPYAKPPVGDLRFKAPQPAEPWTGVRDALEQGSICPQGLNAASEDCLFINVYTSHIPKNTSEKLLPTLVWIHGGAYHFGSGNIEQQGPDYLLEEDIVVVTLNYRLAALGFISLPGTEISSNNGLKDQSLALSWVQQNIAQFGGDPDYVTIWGESAGAGSVHGHMLSPYSKGLFHQVISESGSVLGAWSMYAPGVARDSAFKLGGALDEGINNTVDTSLLIKVLRSASVLDILNATSQYGLQFTLDVESDVSLEEEPFLPAPPLELIKEGKYHDVPLLIGTNSHEGLIEKDQLSQGTDYLNEHFELLLPWHFGSSQDVAAQVKRFYFGDKKLSTQTAMQFVNMETDFMFLYPVDHQVKLQAEISSTPIYYYRFTFDGLLGWDRRTVGDSIPGVPHAEELGYLFYTSYNDPGLPLDRPEVTTLKRMVKMWTNFVKTGNPTPSADSLLQNITWSPFTKLDHFYLDIGRDLIMKRDVENDRLGFMTDIYSTINIDIPSAAARPEMFITFAILILCTMQDQIFGDGMIIRPSALVEKQFGGLEFIMVASIKKGRHTTENWIFWGHFYMTYGVYKTIPTK